MTWLLQPTEQPGQGSLYLDSLFLLVPLPVSLEEKCLNSNNCSSKDNGTNDGDRDVGRKKPGGVEKKLVGGPLLMGWILFEEMVTHCCKYLAYSQKKWVWNLEELIIKIWTWKWLWLKPWKRITLEFTENEEGSRIESWGMPNSDVRMKNRSHQRRHRSRMRVEWCHDIEPKNGE